MDKNENIMTFCLLNNVGKLVAIGYFDKIKEKLEMVYDVFGIEESERSNLTDRITEEVIYYLLYHNTHIPGMLVSYEDYLSRVDSLLKIYKGWENVIYVILELPELVSELPELVEVNNFFFNKNRWGYYHVSCRDNKCSIVYLGDYRILMWYESTAKQEPFSRLSLKELILDDTYTTHE